MLYKTNPAYDLRRRFDEYPLLVFPAGPGRYQDFALLNGSRFLGAAVTPNNQPPRSQDPPVLIWDIDLNLANDVPRNFRTTNDRPNEGSGEKTVTTGLSDLRASGSGEFSLEKSSKTFVAANAWSRDRVRLAPGNALVRQRPASERYASHDWANVGRTQADIEKQEAEKGHHSSPAVTSKSGLASRSNMGTAVLSRRNK